MPPPGPWPVFANVANGFATGPFARPRTLFDEFAVRQTGSGRPAGPRDLLWQTVVVAGLGALEAGLEEILLGAHAVRLGCQGHAVDPRVNAPDANPAKWLAEDRLIAPGPVKIERILFADFGILLGALPSTARFEVRFKNWSLGGSGKGSRAPGPTNWQTLSAFLETLNYIRNAAAHGDAAKLRNPPPRREGDLWLRKANGIWSVQQPHALTALRTVMATFNLVATELAAATSQPAPSLTLPNTVTYP